MCSVKAIRSSSEYEWYAMPPECCKRFYKAKKNTKQKKVYTRYVVHTLVSLRYGDSVVSLRHISLLCRFVSLMNRYVAFLTVPTASLPRENMFRRILILKLNNRPPTYSQLKNRTHTDHVQIDHLDPRLPF